MSLAKLFRFHGGIKPDAHKVAAVAPITVAPLPDRLVVPLRQSARAAAKPLVAVGDRVRTGQPIGAPEGPLGTTIHAPGSGEVVAIRAYPIVHPSGLSVECVVIALDGEDRWVDLAPFDWRTATRDDALAHLRACGVVGLGGAAFPSHIKVGSGTGIDTLVINGAECEPWITCDDRLMREHPHDILGGARLLGGLMQAGRILIGIEDNKPEAIAALRTALESAGTPLPGGLPEARVEIVPVPSRYPAGGEKQLVRVLTGVEVPYGRLASEFGVQCFNVGTARAVHRAFALGEPLVSRVVTLTGNVAQPLNVVARIGTPASHLLALAHPQDDTDRVLMGGPMMGVPLPDPDAPVVKATNCLLAASPTLMPPPPPEQPCIRCGSCAQACPAELQPFELYWFSRAHNFGKAQEYHLFDCIECGCCSYVCPSSIPLVDYYRFAKSEIWAREREKTEADRARERFEARNARFEREKAEKAARLAAKAAETRAKLAAAGPTDASAEAGKPDSAGDDAKKALIAAALERAKAQKAAAKPRNTDPVDPAIQAEIAAIDERRGQ